MSGCVGTWIGGGGSLPLSADLLLQRPAAFRTEVSALGKPPAAVGTPGPKGGSTFEAELRPRRVLLPTSRAPHRTDSKTPRYPLPEKRSSRVRCSSSASSLRLGRGASDPGRKAYHPPAYPHQSYLSSSFTATSERGQEGERGQEEGSTRETKGTLPFVPARVFGARLERSQAVARSRSIPPWATMKNRRDPRPLIEGLPFSGAAPSAVLGALLFPTAPPTGSSGPSHRTPPPSDAPRTWRKSSRSSCRAGGRGCAFP
jgi:hypothetical protein